MNESCQACLSRDRKLTPISSFESVFQHISFWELSSLPGGICWECVTAIRKFNNFKLQVKHAQKLLQTNAKEIAPLTKLSLITKQNEQYNFTYDPLSQTTQEIKVKIEPILETDNTDSKEKWHNEEQLLDEIQSFELKPTTDIYVDIFKSSRKKKKKKLKNIKSIKKEEDVSEKFTTVMLTEEEMLRNREEKRNQPNFKKIPFKCDLCVLGFTRKEKFDFHFEKKHREKNGPHICPVCQIRFQTEKQVARHKSKHYVSYRCKLCKYETVELWSALSHCRTKHMMDQLERIHCSYCKLVAKTPEELSEHMSAEHSVYCNDCGEKFKKLSTLRTHIRRIHTIKREFTCDLCTKAFKTKSRLESHLVNHNESIARRLSYCAPCQTQYKNIYVYRNHLRTSANHADQTYQCIDCDKKFASKVYWKKHINFYHLHKSQFRCELCNKLFISDWRLKNHRQTQHGLSRTRDHPCPVCGKQFFTLSTLKGHQLTHSEHRSFMCEDCGDTFKQRPALYTHCKLVHRCVKRLRKIC